MQTLRRALGDDQAEVCGRCSHCQPGKATLLDNATPDVREQAQQWLLHRPVSIAASMRPEMAAGLALLDGQLRTPLYVHFMRTRANRPGVSVPATLPAELTQLLRIHVQQLGTIHAFSAIVPLPSRTWEQRDATAELLAGWLDVPALLNLLVWREQPAERQGNLLNNDQRRDNVQGKMGVVAARALPNQGALLLLDDYTGSGNTLKAAAETLRKQAGFQGAIVPLTIARVRWRLGARGMV
jgi:ATP-dependent DNA helicase RecQ